MKFFTNFLKFCTKRSRTKGFTLAELLIAASLTSVVVSGAGLGLLTMLQQDIKSRATSTLSHDINRSVEFISQEIRMARDIKTNAATAVSQIKDFTLPTGATPILVLSLNNGKNVVYYSQPAPQPWGGEQVVVRWGPNFDQDGQYDQATLDQPAQWAKNAVLMDFINDTPLDSSQCPQGWQPTHANATEGFYACVSATEETTRLVTLGMGGITHHVVGSDTDYAVATTAFARSDNPASSVARFNCQGNDCTIPDQSTLTIDILGTQLTCGAGGDPIPVYTQVGINQPKAGSQNTVVSSSLTMQVEAGTTIDLYAVASGGSCKHSYSVTTKLDYTPVRVYALLNGSEVPNIQPFANQNSINNIIKPYIENGKVKLSDNQVIYLFELGSKPSPDPAFDVQDLVILASLKKP